MRAYARTHTHKQLFFRNGTRKHDLIFGSFRTDGKAVKMGLSVSSRTSAIHFHKQRIRIEAFTMTKFNKIFLGLSAREVLLNIQLCFTRFVGKSPRSDYSQRMLVGILVRPSVLEGTKP
jgi:hypothetical protein